MTANVGHVGRSNIDPSRTNQESREFHSISPGSGVAPSVAIRSATPPHVGRSNIVQHRAASLDDLLAALDAPPRPAWQRDALCREHPDVDYFSAKRPDPAKAVCQRCLCRAECLQWALDDPALDAGDAILGGLTVAERRALRRQRADAPGGGPDPCPPGVGTMPPALRVLCEEAAPGSSSPGGGWEPPPPGVDPNFPAIRSDPSPGFPTPAEAPR